jgi:hypothetical protein
VALPAFLLRYQQFASNPYCGAAGLPRWRRNRRRLRFEVFRFFTEVTVTGDSFLNMLENWLLPQLNTNYDDYILQLDGFPPSPQFSHECTSAWTPFQTHYFSEILVPRGIGPGPLDLYPGTMTTIPKRRSIFFYITHKFSSYLTGNIIHLSSEPGTLTTRTQRWSTTYVYSI